MLLCIQNVKIIKMRLFTMFIAAACVLFLIRLRWPKNKGLYGKAQSEILVTLRGSFQNLPLDQ